jgi:hypothetical protein
LDTFRIWRIRLDTASAIDANGSGTGSDKALNGRTVSVLGTGSALRNRIDTDLTVTGGGKEGQKRQQGVGLHGMIFSVFFSSSDLLWMFLNIMSHLFRCFFL